MSDPILDRNLVLLAADDRFVRRNALKAVQTAIKRAGESNCKDFPFAVYASHLSLSLNDTVEVNRELAVVVNKDLIDAVPSVSVILPSLLPALTKRLGQKEVVEPSEELRLETLRLLKTVLDKSVDVNPYVDDYLSILRVTISDAFHEVKKLSCVIAQELASRKSHRFYQTSEIIIEPLLSCLVHQHSKVRSCAINSLGRVLLYSQGKLVDQVIAPLTQRLFDPIPAVRRSVIEIAGSWLLDLPDRYSFHTKLLPLILSGFTDESEEIRDLTADYWHDIGLKFEKENEEQLKDKLDFDKGPPFHYPLGCKRPVVGCRELVYRSASRLLPALCRDLGDWQEATRTKAAALLPILVIHLEESTTQHTQHLITGLTTGLADTIAHVAPSTGSVALLKLVPPIAFRGLPLAELDPSVNREDQEFLIPRIPALLASGSTDTTEAVKVIHQLLLTAELIGCVVQGKLWWPLVNSCLDRCAESVAPASLAGHLFLLAGLISGSPHWQLTSSSEDYSKKIAGGNTVPSVNGDNLTLIEPEKPCTLVRSIALYLAQHDILSVVSFAAKAALLDCVLAILRRMEEAVVLLRSSLVGSKEHISLNSSARKEESIVECAKILLADTQLRSCLFQVILALGGVWADTNSTNTEFGSTILQLVDEGMRRLAACERDYRICMLPQPPPKQTERPHCPMSSLLETASPMDVDRLYVTHMFQLFHRLDLDRTEAGSWHPKSVGLAIFSRCLQTAGPALLMDSPCPTSGSSATNCLGIVLRLLEQGCRLDRTPGTDTGKSPGGPDPLTMASEAELRLRGLILLTRLTDNDSVRTALASPAYLCRCLTGLVLPACVWRAGRTAEAMRKAAVTCLVALLAAATSVYDLDEAAVDSRTQDEVRLDSWLCENVESVKKLLGDKTSKLNKKKISGKGAEHQNKHTSSLCLLPSSVLSVLLARLGGLLEDDSDATRRMACLNLTLLFDGLLLPSTPSTDAPATSSVPPELEESKKNGARESEDFLSSPTWLLPTQNGDSSVLPENQCPLPNSFGDQVYRFYPNLVRRLNDTKDPIRLIASETLNAWLRLVHRMLTCQPSSSTSESQALTNERPLMNPVHSAVMDDFVVGVLPHLDDAEDQIRAAVSRVLARVGQIAPDLIRAKLTAARECHRCAYMCDKVLESLRALE
ncbi:unnamed protein product [Calicophoron daubneyi]|uniref:Dynein assembly factor 5, axonemal n=1 Tax=Calicophoron daubneyi TaxID=300641 RepID=A0AAV2TBU6_CALDB